MSRSFAAWRMVVPFGTSVVFPSMVSFISLHLSFHNHRTEVTYVYTSPALIALTVVDPVRLVLLAENRFFRTLALAHPATVSTLNADLRVDPVDVQLPADVGRTFVRLNVRKILIAEIT